MAKSASKPLRLKGKYALMHTTKEVRCVVKDIQYKLDINSLSYEELKQHPYLDWKKAKAIIAYRKNHGNYTSIADLKKCHLVTNELAEKLAPYLQFSNPSD